MMPACHAAYSSARSTLSMRRMGGAISRLIRLISCKINLFYWTQYDRRARACVYCYFIVKNCIRTVFQHQKTKDKSSICKSSGHFHIYSVRDLCIHTQLSFSYFLNDADVILCIRKHIHFSGVESGRSSLKSWKSRHLARRLADPSRKMETWQYLNPTL